ncbi:hypothetical protein RM549_06100 [Salegentibacter sp. F188]|uniref:Uncharacterized protein n=1 Tax=Autumnicola patrickiae TaxID=3075591 RepID=A0ABU3E023_9FLAO|nr:hypothetical protein [Salegentibacter sp. F188]MDT0689349.1 hypothetical protein [Salegentibacter sp. F188]
MSQLTEHIVYATYSALDEEAKEAFIRLIEEDKKKYSRKKPKRKSVYDKLPAKFHPDNIEMLVAEIMHS